MSRADSVLSEAWEGARRTAPILLAVLPFAAVFGALAMERGWSAGEVLLASGTIYAGASQYVMLDLWGQGVAPWLIVLTVFAVNARHLLYSAAIGRRLGAFSTVRKVLAFALLVDPQFAESEARSRETRLTPAFYFGYGLALWLSWMSANVLGIAFGGLVEEPSAWGLDMVLPLYFLALVVSMRSADRFGGIVVVSGATALATFAWLGTPWHIMAGGVAGMAYAALRAGRPRGVGEAA